MARTTAREHLDVLVIGAGLSGIGAACRLREDHPRRRIAVLEARGRSGGTWDLFRYPGVRSDSDLYTFGYDFRPWQQDTAIADGASIRRYIRRTAAAYGVEELIRYHHRVVSADWSSEESRWLVRVELMRTPPPSPDGTRPEPVGTGEVLELTATWLFSASGYYRYDAGYTPELPGRDRFHGRVVHPQHWPDGLQVSGRRVAVIGSGATAVTLVPALVDLGAEVTMVQRTPTYILPVPRTDPLAAVLRRAIGPERTGRVMAEVTVRRQRAVWSFCRRFPTAARAAIRRVNTRALPAGFPVEEHLQPPYDPWDQRLCIVPDGDFFTALRSGRARIRTGRVAGLTEQGVELESGEEVRADVVVTATGFTLQVLGGIDLRVDGERVHHPDRVAYRGIMLSGVPNLAFCIGYTNASWTLKVGLLTRWFSRLLTHMDTHGWTSVVPVAPAGLRTRPLLDLGAGYIRRSLDALPRQGTEPPWVMTMSFLADRKDLNRGALVDEHLRFSGPEDRDAGPDRFVTLPSGVRLCYRVDGPDGGEPVVLVAGLGLDLTSWPTALVEGLVELGLRVLRLDNRDAGRSSRMSTPAPGPARLLAARPLPGTYRVEDMAEDVVGLLDALGLDRAHLIGMSLGGMIGQSVAAHHPERVITLTSIFSTTGARGAGMAAASTKARLARRPARGREEFIRARVAMMRHLAGPSYPVDEAVETELAASAWDRAPSPDGGAARARQIGAVQSSQDRTADLARIVAPTLVVHGERDLMVHPSGGTATAAAIPGARHVTLPGMGHHLQARLVPELLSVIEDHVTAHREAARG